MSRKLVYALNKTIRHVAMRAMSRFPSREEAAQLDLHTETIQKILLVRPNFRMGNTILSIPAVRLFREHFPDARVDFVGSPVSRPLFEGLGIDHHFEVSRSYLDSVWLYPRLVDRIRSAGFDLAVEISGSQSALGSFIVGLSGAKLKIGRQGKWDFWFNVRLPKPAEKNKYRVLPALLGAIGLKSENIYPALELSAAERAIGHQTIATVLGKDATPVIGVSVGGRERRGKRWPKENFLALIAKLRRRAIRVVVFIGPEEKDLTGYFKTRAPAGVPVVCEPSLRLFAAMISRCELFVACDSGPVHLACAVGTRTIAIFQNSDFDRWGPPPALGRVLYNPTGVGVEEVERACRDELYRVCLNAVAGTR